MKRLHALPALAALILSLGCTERVTQPLTDGDRSQVPLFSKSASGNGGEIAYSAGNWLGTPGTPGSVLVTDLYWLDLKSNKTKQLTTSPGLDQMPDWSPNGDRLVFSSTGSNSTLLDDLDLYVMEIAADGTPGTITQVTSFPGPEIYAAWSPRGDQIAYSCVPTGLNTPHICLSTWDAASGTWGAPVFLTSGPPPMLKFRIWDTRPTWSPDGTQILFARRCYPQVELCDFSDRDLFMLTAPFPGAPAGWPPPVRVTKTPTINEDNPSWNPTPGSREIAYNVLSNLGDPSETNYIFVDTLAFAYVMADPPITIAGTQLTTSGYEDYPWWTPLGNELLYLHDFKTGMDVYRMSADGSNQKNITSTPHTEEAFAVQRPGS